MNIFAYDYEGYGNASGFPTEATCYANIEAAYGYLTEMLLVSPENIVL